LAAGDINVQQAQVIVEAVVAVAEHGSDIQAEVEKVLLHPDCTVLDPKPYVSPPVMP
jgi:hypothetical protein